jgi:hypothetical protein
VLLPIDRYGNAGTDLIENGTTLTYTCAYTHGSYEWSQVSFRRIRLQQLASFLTHDMRRRLVSSSTPYNPTALRPLPACRSRCREARVIFIFLAPFCNLRTFCKIVMVANSFVSWVSGVSVQCQL